MSTTTSGRLIRLNIRQWAFLGDTMRQPRAIYNAIAQAELYPEAEVLTSPPVVLRYCREFFSLHEQYRGHRDLYVQDETHALILAVAFSTSTALRESVEAVRHGHYGQYELSLLQKAIESLQADLEGACGFPLLYPDE